MAAAGVSSDVDARFTPAVIKEIDAILGMADLGGLSKFQQNRGASGQKYKKKWAPALPSTVRELVLCSVHGSHCSSSSNTRPRQSDFWLLCPSVLNPNPNSATTTVVAGSSAALPSFVAFADLLPKMCFYLLFRLVV